MANIYKGVGINWGVAGVTCTAFGTFKMQSNDYNKNADIAWVADGDGNDVAGVAYNQSETAQFSYVASATSGSTAAPTIPAIFDVVTVSDSTFTNLSGSWLVNASPSVKRTNKSAMIVDVPLIKKSYITLTS